MKPFLAIALVLGALAPGGTGLAGPVEGPVLPLSLVDPRDGSAVRLEPGGVLHLAFLATWCPECLAELPQLAELEARWRSRGYRLVLVAVRHRQDAERLARFVSASRPPGRLLWDGDGRAGDRLGVAGLPLHIVLGRDGAERARFEAAGPALAAEIESAVAGARR